MEWTININKLQCEKVFSWQLKHSIWSTRAVLVSTCPFFTFYPSFHHPSADALACFHPIITFHFALWCEGRNKWKAAAFSSGGETVSAETQSAYLSLPSEGFSFISSPLFFFFHSRKAWRADVETVQPQWCRSDRKATTIRSKFPNLWVLCYHKQKYDGLWRVRRPLTHKRHFQNNKNVRLGLGLLAWMLTDIVVHGNSSESEETWTEF